MRWKIANKARSAQLARTITIIVLLKMPKRIEIFELPQLFSLTSTDTIFVSMVYELIYHRMLTNQNSGIAIASF